MKPTLLQWICCPECTGALRLEDARGDGQEILSGSLRCERCGAYPIVDGIPRLVSRRSGGASGDRAGTIHAGEEVPRAAECAADRAGTIHAGEEVSTAAGLPTKPSPEASVRQRTQRSFGFQWTQFSRMHPVFEANFLNYVVPLTPETFRGRLVLDAGCGFGRHLYYAARYGAEVIGVDVSAAADSAYRNTAHLPTAHVVQADLYRLPFKPGTFDLVYSIGVLHHLPSPETAFHNLLRYLAPGGRVAIWVYSSARQGINAALEAVRRVTTRLPLPVLLGLSWLAGLMDWALFIWPYRLAHAWPVTRAAAERLAWPRVKMYAAYPLDVCVADWLDRLSAPVRFYYDAEQLRRWCERQDVDGVQLSPTGRYGWRMSARRRASPPSTPSGASDS